MHKKTVKNLLKFIFNSISLELILTSQQLYITHFLPKLVCKNVQYDYLSIEPDVFYHNNPNIQT